MTTIATRTEFTETEIRSAYASAKRARPLSPYAMTAKQLSGLGRGEVSRQLARYWVLMLEEDERADPVGDEISFDELRRSRHRHTENLRLRRQEREILDAAQTMHEFESGVASAISRLNRREFTLTPPVSKDSEGTPMTVELLLSDLQMGKLIPGYDSPTAILRLREYTRAALFQIDQKVQAGYRVERIVIAILGDIIESDKKHKNSGRATDCGTSEQIALALEHIFKEVIEPLALLGIPVEVIAVGGNHDWDDHGMAMFAPGRELLSYPLYKAMELLTATAKYHHVTFNIPAGPFAVTSFYGQNCLYEHGVGVSSNDTSMRTHKAKRAEQLNHPLTYFRMGHLHNVTLFNAGQHIINGAFFGADSTGIDYSSIAGYSSVPAQTMCFHVPRNDRRHTLYDVFLIQLGHINNKGA